jgi:diguanylate cyclase
MVAAQGGFVRRPIRFRVVLRPPRVPASISVDVLNFLRPWPTNHPGFRPSLLHMNDAAAERQWKDQYREVLRELEAKEREWAALERALRAAAGKLALAAMGDSDELDGALQTLSEKLRGKGSAAEVDAGVSTVLRRLHVHDTTRTNMQFPDLPVLLRGLVRSLGRIPEFDEAAAGLEKRLAVLAPGGWAAFLDSVAREVGGVVDALRAQRAELEEFLEQVTRQLAMLEGFTTWQVTSAKSRREESAGLERAVETQIGGLRRDVEETGDLALIKGKVQSRLAAVAVALHEFRERETRRDAENEKRAAELRREVMQLQTRTTELAEICAAQENRLMIDSLTGVRSRYAYEQRLIEEHGRWQRHGQPLSYMMLDIDRFKLINDQLGHDAGDRLLRAVAQLLNRHKRSEDFLARVGGEEFALLLPMAPLDAALAVANKLREAIEAATFHHKGRREKVTISCGVTEFRAGDSPSVVYDRADRALYRAKEEGRNRCVAD